MYPNKLLRRRVLWNIALINFNDKNFSELSDIHPLKVFSSKKIQVNANHIEFIADPFLFVEKDELFMFFEEKKLTTKGYIKAYKTNDLKIWQDCGEILKANYHLSFPNVFRFNDEIFMLPEAAESQRIILYKCINFPKKWTPYHELPNFNGKYVDSSIIYHEGKYYLFTTKVTIDNGIQNYKLLLFFSDSLIGEWTEHPASPISKEMQNARCAGSIFELNNKLYRPAQDCSIKYGENYSIFEITQLSKTKYIEIINTKNLVNFKHNWSSIGGHHFNLTVFKNKTIVATDGLQKDCWINIILSIVSKSLNKIYLQYKTYNNNKITITQFCHSKSKQ